MFRTDPDSERHKGLTFILVPLKAAELRDVGIEDDLISRALERLHPAHERA